MKILMCVLAYFAFKNVKSGYNYGVVNLYEKANNAFSANYLDAVMELNPGQSVVVSGFALLKPLAQLSIGAEGKAHSELLKVIGMPDDDVTKIVYPIVYDRVKEEDTKPGVCMKIASSFYIPIGKRLNADYAIDMEKLFHAQVQNINFKKNLEAAREINDWVANQTDNKIHELIDPAIIAGDTTLVLVNAIYFKGRWKKSFHLSNTEYRDFYSNKTFYAKLRTMFKKDTLDYAESSLLDAQLLNMPYEAEHFSLLVILPNKLDGLFSLLRKLHYEEVLQQAIKAMKPIDVNVFLPRIKIETRNHIKNPLAKVGVQQIFKSINSGLDKVLSTGSIFISDAVEQVNIEINEEGTEAVGANAIIGSKSLLSGKEFRANHPFVFFLKCGPTTLFSGVFTGYGDNYLSRDGESLDEKRDMRISFDVPIDISYLPT